MKYRYKRCVWLLILAVLTLPVLAQQVKHLTVFHTNDTHSRIEPIPETSANIHEAGRGGTVRRATFIKQMREKDPQILLFDCGDFSQGTPYYNEFKGEVEIAMMNVMKYDAGTIGNHEFDFGMENMARLFRMADFPIVCANYDFTGTVLEKLVKPYVVIKRNGLRIGVFGLGVKLEGLVQADKCEGVIYNDPIEIANKVAGQLKTDEKCDVVICLSHLGYRPSAGNPVADISLIENTRNIDMVLGGHSHTLLEEPVFYHNLDGKEVPVSQMGRQGVFVGRMDLLFREKQ